MANDTGPNSGTDYMPGATGILSQKQGGISAYLQLMRFPNVFTAMADILAGYLVLCRNNFQWHELFLLFAASSAIYAGGCVLNDICDREVDARERPFRPIPSGRVSLRAALVLAAALLATGLLAASLSGKMPLLFASFLVAAAVSYDLFTKERAIAGPLNMAVCRALNLALGMSPASSLSLLFVIFPLVSLVYVFSLTMLSRFEVDGTSGRKGLPALGGWMVAASALVGLILHGAIGVGSLVYFLIFITLTGPPLLRAVLSSSPHHVGTAVKVMILCIPILDAVYSSGILGWSYGIPVALLALPAFYISRHLYVT